MIYLKRFRKCRLTTSGPWHEIGNTKLLDVSLLYDENTDSFKVWAIASNGDALYRRGVTKSNPSGTSWEHIVANNQPLVSISLSKATGVWAIGRNGLCNQILKIIVNLRRQRERETRRESVKRKRH